MLKRPHTALITLIVLVFLGSVSFADLNHAHFLAADFPTEHQLHSHDCGQAEVHKNITPTFHCVASCRVLGSLLLPRICLGTDQSVQSFLWMYDEALNAPDDCFTQFQRGPPVSSV